MKQKKMSNNGVKYTKLGRAIRIPATALVEVHSGAAIVRLRVGHDEMTLTMPESVWVKWKDGLLGESVDARIMTLAEFKKSIK